MTNLENLNELYKKEEHLISEKFKLPKLQQDISELEKQTKESIYQFANEHFDKIGNYGWSYKHIRRIDLECFYDSNKKTGLEFAYSSSHPNKGIRVLRNISPERFEKYTMYRQKDNFWPGLISISMFTLVGPVLTAISGISACFYYEHKFGKIRKAHNSLEGKDAILHMLENYPIEK